MDVQTHPVTDAADFPGSVPSLADTSAEHPAHAHTHTHTHRRAALPALVTVPVKLWAVPAPGEK